MRLKSKDIAEILNISPSAVSLAINNKPGVSDKTRNKVNSLVEEYYRTGRLKVVEEDEKEPVRKSIVLVIHRKQKGFITASNFFLQIIENIQAGAMDSGYNLEIFYRQHLQEDDKAFIENFNGSHVAGVLLFATELSYEDLDIYFQINKPLVVIDSRFVIEGLDTVTLNNRHGLISAVQYAYECGHRKIGYLKSKSEINNFHDRFAGYLSGLEMVGIPFDPDLVFTVGSTIESSYKDFLNLLAQPSLELPSIFVTELDFIIIGALRALKKMNFRVPDQISLIGFDDYELCAQMSPPITTLRADPSIGTAAINRLIEKISKNTPYSLNIEVGTKLIKRGTVKAL